MAKIEVKDKPTRIIAKLPYYKHPAHLLATIRKDTNNADFEFPDDDDTDGWETVWNVAKAHATFVPDKEPKVVLTEEEAPYEPTNMQESVDKQVKAMLENAAKSTQLKNRMPTAGKRQLSR